MRNKSAHTTKGLALSKAKGFTLIRTLPSKNLVKVQPKGFTLIELLVVIAIVSLLATLLLVVINPIEMQRKGRDSRRLDDMVSLRKAIDLAINDRVALPNAMYNSVNQSRDVDNTPTNYLNMNVGNYIPMLPTDPLNSDTTTNRACTGNPVPPNNPGWRYRFAANGNTYELNIYLESESNCPRAGDSADGGNNDSIYEVGTDLTLFN